MDRDSVAGRSGHQFANPELLRQALTHRSHSASHNERLEFLGDGVLNCVIAAELFRRFPQLAEGELSRLRASLVNQQCLFEIAQHIDLGAQLRLGEGELKSGGARRPSILADAMEAVVGAAFLDAGFEAARGVVRTLLGADMDMIDPASSGKDPKTLLQEHLQSRRMALPQYAVVATRGEAHEQLFEVECLIPELRIRSLGAGTSRRGAEQEAARHAYELASRA